MLESFCCCRSVTFGVHGKRDRCVTFTEYEERHTLMRITLGETLSLNASISLFLNQGCEVSPTKMPDRQGDLGDETTVGSTGKHGQGFVGVGDYELNFNVKICCFSLNCTIAPYKYASQNTLYFLEYRCPVWHHNLIRHLSAVFECTKRCLKLHYCTTCVKIWSELGIQWTGVLAFGENCSEICRATHTTHILSAAAKMQPSDCTGHKCYGVGMGLPEAETSNQWTAFSLTVSSHTCCSLMSVVQKISKIQE